jgi:hypothetical protein
MLLTVPVPGVTLPGHEYLTKSNQIVSSNFVRGITLDFFFTSALIERSCSSLVMCYEMFNFFFSDRISLSQVSRKRFEYSFHRDKSI